MKFLALLSLISTSAFAIEFITPEQVQEKLGAEMVVEVSKYDYEEKVKGNEACTNAILSKSGRAYAVKLNGEGYLYLTASGLSTLINCGKL